MSTLPSRPKDPLLPRTWHRDLSYARDLLKGATPRGVLWVSELKGGDRDRASYKLVVVSEHRLFVTTGKAGLVSGVFAAQNAHLFDLTSIVVAPGDRMEFHFKKLSVVIDDTVGPSLVSTVWNALLALSYEVPETRLPALEGSAEAVVTDLPLLGETTSPAEGFAASYRGACDQLGVKARACVERYVAQALLDKNGSPRSPFITTTTTTNSAPGTTAEDKKDDLPQTATPPAVGVVGVRVFDLGAACRDDEHGGKFNDADLPALARPLSSTTHFDAVALQSSSSSSSPSSSQQQQQDNANPGGTDGPGSGSSKLSTEAARALLSALDLAPRMRRILLVGVGLTAAKVEKVDAPNGFRRVTHWNLADNPLLGPKGVAKLLGDGQRGGPEKLERLELRGCGPLRSLPLKPAWGATLRYLDATRCDVSKSNDAIRDWLAEDALVLEVLILAHCGLNVLSIVAGVAENVKLVTKSLRVLDLSLNKCLHEPVEDAAAAKPQGSAKGAATKRGAAACRSLLAKATSLDRLVLAKCDLPLAALDALLAGLNDRASEAAAEDLRRANTAAPDDDTMLKTPSSKKHVVALYLADNSMHNKHGAVFFDRLSPQGPQRLSSPLRQLNLDRSYLGTVGLRDLFAALAASGAPHLTNLSLRCTASKGGLFANKKKHEEMARSLAEVVLKCGALERLTLAGGDGSHFKADLLPALAALGSNSSLKVLDVVNNHCGDDAIQALAGSLTVNQTLQKVALDGNSASATAVKALAESLTRNTTLHTCDLPRRDAALAARNLTTDKERADLSKAMKDMKQALQRNYRTQQKRHHRKHLVSTNLNKAGSSSFSFRRQHFGSWTGGGSSSSGFFSTSLEDAANEDDDDDDDSVSAAAPTKGTPGDDEHLDLLDDDDDVVHKRRDSLPNVSEEDDDFDDDDDDEKAAAEKAAAAAPKEKHDDDHDDDGKPTPLPPPPPNKKKKTRGESSSSREGDVAHRLKIFEEILESETNYVRDLGVICHIFLAPIEKHDILKRDDVDKVFGNVRELRQIHEELLSKLRSATRKHRDAVHAGKAEEAAAAELATRHAQIFSEMVPFLRAYAGYCATYTTAIELVKQLSEGRANPKFAKFLQRATTVPQCRGLDLASFLIKPPQRLCKYPLFFRDLLKHISVGGNDDDDDAINKDGNNKDDDNASRRCAELISKTLDAVQGVTNTVNQTMATSGSQAKVFEIFKENFDCHESLTDLVSPTRRFLVEGDVDFATHEKPPKKHHFYLFNDLLVLSTPRKSLSGAEVPGKFKVKHRFALVDVSITDAPASISLNANDHFFQIRFEDQGSGGSFSVHWATEQRPQRADFLLWCDDANECEQLRGALQQASYDIKILHEGLEHRRRSTKTRNASSPDKTPSVSSSPRPKLDPDDDDDDDDAATEAPPVVVEEAAAATKTWVGSAARAEAPAPPPLPATSSSKQKPTPPSQAKNQQQQQQPPPKPPPLPRQATPREPPKVSRTAEL